MATLVVENDDGKKYTIRTTVDEGAIIRVNKDEDWVTILFPDGFFIMPEFEFRWMELRNDVD